VDLLVIVMLLPMLKRESVRLSYRKMAAFAKTR